MLNKIYYFFYTVSRGYSLPTSVTSWFVIYLYSLKAGGNAVYGLIAFVGIIVAHLGTNLFDDCIDTIFKVPKQKCKTEYFDKNIFSLRFIIFATVIYFLLVSIIGLYFFKIYGINILFLAIIAAIVIILYPHLNHYALGELAVGLMFGPLLFIGIYYVMTNSLTLNSILLSLPVGILIMNLLFVHSIMDSTFDKLNNKKTLAVRLGSLEKSISLFVCFAIFVVLIHGYLIFKGIVSLYSILAIIPVIYFYFTGIKRLNSYSEGDFLVIFKLIRNAALWYNIILGISLLW